MGVFAGRNHFVGDKGGGFVGGHATVFLKPLIFSNAPSAKAPNKFRGGFFGAGFGVDAFDDALIDSVLERNFVVAPAHRVAVFMDVANDLVKEAVHAAMSGDDRKCSAPSGDGFGDGVEKLLILVQGEFVQFHVTALAGEGIRI